jgi:ubiquinone/menaquinone biosynthesis C-methylase UbiE
MAGRSAPEGGLSYLRPDLLRRVQYGPTWSGAALPAPGQDAMQRFFADPVRSLEYGGETVQALEGHFDPARPGIGPQFLGGAESYDAGYFNSDALEAQIGITLGKLGRTDFRPETILDVGSGSGNSVLALARLYPGARIIASDLSPRMVALLDRRLAAQRLRDRVSAFVADASRMQPRPGLYDLVMGSSMLHHLLDPFATLHRLLRALRPGGIAVFYEPFQAGSFFLRQAFLEIIRRAPEKGGVEERVIEFLKVCILGVNVVSSATRDHPVIPNLDDKWLFTRAHFQKVADEAGCARLLIYSTCPAEDTFHEKARGLLRSGLGEEASLPEWVHEILRSYDEHVSPLLREELLMEAGVVFVK